MKPVSELLKRRNSAVWRIEPGATMFDALEHLTNPARALHKAHGLLRPGGHVVGTVPNRGRPPANLVDAMKAKGPAPREYDPKVKPVMDLLTELLARTDLTRISVEKAGFKLELETDA